MYKALKSCTTDLQHNGSVKPLMLDLGCWFQCAHGNVFILLSKMKLDSHFMTHCDKKYLKFHNASYRCTGVHTVPTPCITSVSSMMYSYMI